MLAEPLLPPAPGREISRGSRLTASACLVVCALSVFVVLNKSRLDQPTLTQPALPVSAETFVEKTNSTLNEIEGTAQDSGLLDHLKETAEETKDAAEEISKYALERSQEAADKAKNALNQIERTAQDSGVVDQLKDAAEETKDAAEEVMKYASERSQEAADKAKKMWDAFWPE